MNRSSFLHPAALLLAASLSGCGGSGSSGNDVMVSDGRSVVLAIDQTVALGDNTYFAVRHSLPKRRAHQVKYYRAYLPISMGRDFTTTGT